MDKISMWIGSMRNSDVQLCPETPLDWSSGPFKIVGVNFTNETNDIWEFNKTDIMNRISTTIKTWSKRKLTLYGKNHIIKSLALSKFVHLFISLPNPPTELIKELDKIFFGFLWNKGPDRIKRIKITNFCQND